MTLDEYSENGGVVDPKLDIFTKRGITPPWEPGGHVARAQGFERYEGPDWEARRAIAASVETLFRWDTGPHKTHRPDWTTPAKYRKPARRKDPELSWQSWLKWAFSEDGWLLPRHAILPDHDHWGDRPVTQLRPDRPVGGSVKKRHGHWEMGALAKWQHEHKVCELAPEGHPYARKHPAGDYLPTGHIHPVTMERVTYRRGKDNKHSHYDEAKYVYTPGDTALRLGTNPVVLERGWGTPDDLFVFVMEGTLKMCSVAEAGYPVIDAGSVTLWHGERVFDKWGDQVSDPYHPFTLDYADVDSWEVEREIDVFAARHLKGRRVAVVCDSDWAENAAVADQTNQVVEALESRGARAVRCAPPPKPDGSKRGIDDWLGEHPQEDRREKFLEIICPGNPVLTVDDPRLAVIRRSDGRKTIVDLVTEMGRQSDGQGLAAYRKKDLAKTLGRSTSRIDHALKGAIKSGLVSKVTEAERRGPEQGMLAPLFLVDPDARPSALTLRSWFES